MRIKEDYTTDRPCSSFQGVFGIHRLTIEGCVRRGNNVTVLSRMHSNTPTPHAPAASMHRLPFEDSSIFFK
jgi:hypothetical protein